MKYSNIRGPCGIHSNVNGRGDGTARHLILLVYISVATEIGHVAIPSGSFVHFSIQRGSTFRGGDVRVKPAPPEINEKGRVGALD